MSGLKAKDHQVRPCCLITTQVLGLCDDAVLRRLPARRVHQFDGHAFDFDTPVQVVARRARLGTHQCLRALHERIEQAALAGIGTPHQDGAEDSIAHSTLLELLAQEHHVRQSLGQPLEQCFLPDKLDVLLGKIQPCLDVGKQVQKIIAQFLQRPSHAAGKLRESLPQFAAIPGLDHGQHRFGLGQLELAGQKCPHGELARLRRPRTRVQQLPN